MIEFLTQVNFLSFFLYFTEKNEKFKSYIFESWLEIVFEQCDE